ncbi:MAG: hypothetical protein A2068_02095, partial [Ignavibacteria bacterium GWB2_35_6b]
AGTVSNGAGGSGTVWTINNGNWASTYSNNGGPVSSVIQAPRNAEIIAGTYDFAISVQAIDATTNEIRWYMIEEDNQYWFGGTITAAATSQKFNSIIFGVNEVPFTQFNVIAMEVDRGEPIEVPEAPWQDYYIDTWSFSKDANGVDINGGWTLTPGELTGNVSIAGTSRGGWSKIEGNFGDVVPKDVRALVLTGKMEFVNGGFSAWNSLQLGVFNKNNSRYNGYLFAPLSGVTDLIGWDNNSKLGTVGAIVNGATIDPREPSYVLSSNLQESGAVAGAGEYDFAFSFGLKGDGTNEVRYYIHNDSYAFGGIINDTHDPIVASKFNMISFAFNNRNNSTTEVNITDALVHFGDPIDIPGEIVSVDETKGLPTEFALNQNYPNPFNPSTTIEFALPQSSNVKLVVYDILGRTVASLVNCDLNAGYHKINFNASNLSSGVYFYSIKAGDFISVKKLMLLK